MGQALGRGLDRGDVQHHHRAKDQSDRDHHRAKDHPSRPDERQDQEPAAGEAAPPDRVSARGAVLKMRRAIHQDRAVERRVREDAGALLTEAVQWEVQRHLDRGPEVANARQELSAIYADMSIDEPKSLPSPK